MRVALVGSPGNIRNVNAIGPDRARNVLHPLIANILEFYAKVFPYLISDGDRDAYPSIGASRSRRAAILTPSPEMSSPSITTSPRLIPMRR